MRDAERTASANPIVAAILAGAAPRPLKLSAARGVLPLARHELVRILVVLAADADAHVSREAASKLASLPEAELLPLLEDSQAAPEVLDHFACRMPGAGALKAAVIANPATPDDTLRRIASSMGPELIDLLLLNQTRLIATPDLLNLLEANSSATALQRSRVEEIRRHFLSAPAPAPASAVDAPHLDHSGDADDATTAPTPVVAPPEADGTAPPGTEAEVQSASMLANANQKIMRMNTAEKIQLAFKGTREDRSILIKDSSKMVQEAVIESPKLSDSEVEAFARMRNVSEEVLRRIAGNRDWVKSYAVVHALATNPKTPIGLAMNLVSRLTSRDLKLLAGDKNVSEMIRRQARKVVEARNQRPGQH
jgi:hypothetical protein